MSASSSKKPKKLVVLDFDNCLTDTYSTLAQELHDFLQDYTAHFGTGPDDLQHAVRTAKGQHRFCDVIGLSDHLKDIHNIPPHSDDPVSNARNDQIRYDVCDRFIRHQKENTEFYPFTLEGLYGVKMQKAAQVILTDAEAPALIRRLYFCSVNAGKDPMKVLDLFDAFYAMPSIECDKRLLDGVDEDFCLAMKRKMVISTSGQWKPCPERLLAVLADFDVAPEDAVMVGDSHKDLATAFPIGVDAVWFQRGAILNMGAENILKSHASPHYKYGIVDVEKEIESVAQGKNYVTLHHNLSEIGWHFTFAPAESAYRHSALSQACQTPLPLAQEDLNIETRPQELRRMFGAATHSRSVPETPAKPNPAGKADLETATSPEETLLALRQS